LFCCLPHSGRSSLTHTFAQVTEPFNHLSVSIDLVDQKTRMKGNNGKSASSFSERIAKELAILEEQKSIGRKLSKRNARKLVRLRKEMEQLKQEASSSESSESAEEDPADDLDPSVLSVENCLRYFTTLERLDAKNKVICMECTKAAASSREDDADPELVYTRSTKQLRLGSLPPVLVVHLKRFMQTTMGLRKDDTFVEFAEYLDLAPFVAPPVDETEGETATGTRGGDLWKYRLCGLSCHGGGMGGGHYVAYVRHSPAGSAAAGSGSAADTEWFYMSDQHVSKTNVETVLKQQAYVLFYERCRAEDISH
jgi:Ubiquitin carboxyl-terminal hydrolase